ncbi:MAG TPA: 16S rRNA (adenine(1518)-N(6)/adenine(1519)-N(6))-dimethyltransferase RsmA [Candidatus Saccharimonadia bacterium]|nr:16S rRNA (adenine(1518)-N(6)/adenine(1519)-N(6))-dimethyltransferase RsmA [Candidatus Saccharimonadia bacterium]
MDFVAQKSLGQHWLNDQKTLSLIINYAELNKSDNVLEIGPGQGALTNLLAPKVKKLVTVEIDSKLVSILKEKYKDTNVEIVHQNILEFDLNKLPLDFKVVANIPYYLTSYLIRVLSEAKNRPKKIVLLIQKEVAARLAAEPGAMSVLSVTCQFYWQIDKKEIVPAELFTPKPKVDSQIVVLNQKQALLLKEQYHNDFFRLVKMGFSSRRKTLENSLSGGLRISKQQANELIKKSDINPNSRPQMLSLDEWFRLYRSFYPY